MKYAGQPCTKEQVRGTVALLRYFRRFLASPYERCVCPEDRHRTGKTLTREQARQRLWFLVDVAINRKAGVPDVQCRKQESDYQIMLFRDCQRVRDRVNRRVIVRQFETKEVRSRFAHLLTRDDD